MGAKGDDGDKGDAGAPGVDGAAGPAGADGSTGPAGPAGADGSTGPAGPAGADGSTGPAGPAGATGSTGPAGPKGDPGTPGAGGVHLVDGNDIVLGRVIGIDREAATVVTSTGYQLEVPFDGVFRPAQIYYSGANCAGDALLNDGGQLTSGDPTTVNISGKWVVYSGSQSTLMEPDTVVKGVAANSTMTAATIDKPDCGDSAGLRSGWRMKPITRAAAGLPATMALPRSRPSDAATRSPPWRGGDRPARQAPDRRGCSTATAARADGPPAVTRAARLPHRSRGGGS